nr:uncharacterized protein LOC112729965 [Arachis hypogaea]
MVMPFGLKNAGATYQRLMNKIFSELIGKIVEVYVDDILAKTAQPDDLLSDLDGIFSSLRQHSMRLNPLKCAFAMEAEKFLGFMITQRGVEANPEKMPSYSPDEEPGLYQRRTTTCRESNGFIPIPQSIGSKIPTFLQSNEKGNDVRMDPSVRKGIQSLQGDLSGTTSSRETPGRRTALSLPISNRGSACRSSH